MIKKEKLTKSQQKVFDTIVKYSNLGRVPSVREICDDTGFSSTSTIFMHLNTLERKGYIEREKGHNRYIKVVGKGLGKSIPVIGMIRAGQPILAQEEISEYIPVTDDISEDSFALKVTGDSMMKVGIYEDDFIVVKPDASINNGDIVAAYIISDSDEYETTVKRYYPEGNYIRLQPENDNYKPIVEPANKIKILGKVVSLFRKF